MQGVVKDLRPMDRVGETMQKHYCPGALLLACLQESDKGKPLLTQTHDVTPTVCQKALVKS